MAERPPRISLLFQVFKTNQLTRTYVRRVLDEAAMRGDDFAVYSLLHVSGPTSPLLLAEGLGMPATTLSGYLAKLEERGHLARRAHPTDGRSHIVALTADGEQVFQAQRGAFSAGLRRLAGELAPGAEERVHAALEELQAALRAASADPPESSVGD